MLEKCSLFVYGKGQVCNEDAIVFYLNIPVGRYEARCECHKFNTVKYMYVQEVSLVDYVANKVMES